MLSMLGARFHRIGSHPRAEQCHRVLPHPRQRILGGSLLEGNSEATTLGLFNKGTWGESPARRANFGHRGVGFKARACEAMRWGAVGNWSCASHVLQLPHDVQNELAGFRQVAGTKLTFASMRSSIHRDSSVKLASFRDV
jgi:hypothetical protein